MKNTTPMMAIEIEAVSKIYTHERVPLARLLIS